MRLTDSGRGEEVDDKNFYLERAASIIVGPKKKFSRYRDNKRRYAPGGCEIKGKSLGLVEKHPQVASAVCNRDKTIE